MIRKILAVTIATCLAGGTFTTVFADDTQTTTAGSVDKKVISETAGILPDSPFYDLERSIEQLQLAITKSQDTLASLKAELAAERAAEAAAMTDSEKVELAEQAAKESMKLFASSAQHINKAIEAKDEAAKTMELLNHSYSESQQLLETILLKAPKESREAIETALNEQDETIAAINGFYAAKSAFFDAKDQLEQMKRELKLAKKAGSPDAIQIAKEKVREAEALKDELEELKDSAESAKEEAETLAEQAEKSIESGWKHIEKANEKMTRIEEKASEAAVKIEEKKNEDKKKQLKEDKKEKEKIKEDLKKARKKAKEEAKKSEE